VNDNILLFTSIRLITDRGESLIGTVHARMRIIWIYSAHYPNQRFGKECKSLELPILYNFIFIPDFFLSDRLRTHTFISNHFAHGIRYGH